MVLLALITDAFRGCVVSVGILFLFLGVSSLREYVRDLPDDDLDHPADAAFDEPVSRELELDGEEINVDMMVTFLIMMKSLRYWKN